MRHFRQFAIAALALAVSEVSFSLEESRLIS